MLEMRAITNRQRRVDTGQEGRSGRWEEAEFAKCLRKSVIVR